MPIDVRLPIGLLFLVLGVMLLGYALVVGTQTSAGHLDLVWGGIMAIFGAVLAFFGQRADARRG